MKCQSCKKQKTKGDMMSNRTCKGCYLSKNNYVEVKKIVKSKCKKCGADYQTTFMTDNGYCLDHFYTEEQETGACKKCVSCKSWFCTRQASKKTCDVCINKGVSEVSSEYYIE